MHILTSNPLTYANSAINATLSGYHAAFWIATGFCVVALVVAFFLKSNNLALHVTDSENSAESTKGGVA